MGIYDREYYREPERGNFLSSNRALVVNLVIATVAVYLIDLFSPAVDRANPHSLHWLSSRLACTPDTLSKPWLWWQFLTYGFLHDPSHVMHIGFNMFVLWMFGREIESIYGQREFLLFYLTAIVLAGVAWAVIEVLQDESSRAGSLIGASGGCIAVLMLFILRYPQRMLLLMFFLPVPAWFVGVLIISADVMGVVHNNPDNQVANFAHLAGAAFAFVYFRSGLRLERWLPGRGFHWPLRSRPNLRIHRPASETDLSQQVDQILEKISREGESSLTAKERRTLENASRQYKERRGS